MTTREKYSYLTKEDFETMLNALAVYNGVVDRLHGGKDTAEAWKPARFFADYFPEVRDEKSPAALMFMGFFWGLKEGLTMSQELGSNSNNAQRSTYTEK